MEKIGKIKRKIIGGRAVAALLAGSLMAALAGCGSGDTAAGGESASDQETSSESEKLADDTSSESGAQGEETASDAEAGTEEAVKVTAATSGGPVPYVTVDENNVISGSDIEILQAVFERLPQYELEIINADDPLTGLTSGLYDIGVNNYNWSDERGELYYFSLPYKSGYDVFIQRKDDEPLTGLQDLADRGYKVEVGAGNNKALALEHWNEENPDHQIDIVYSETDFQMKFQNIIDGKTDVAIDDGPILDSLIVQFGMENDLVGNPIDADTQEFISPHNNTYFLFSKDDEGAALREEVDQALVELKEDGTLSEILTRYFGTDTSPKDEDMQETLN